MSYDPRDFGFKVGKSYGREVSVVCPFHDDHSPSATFNTRTGLFYCFVCKRGYNAQRLAKLLDVKTIIEPSSIALGAPRLPLGEENEWRHRFYSASPALGSEYLESRGVTDEQVSQFDIRKDEEGVLFPLTNQGGALVGIQIRYDRRVAPRYRVFGQKPPLWPLLGFPPKEGKIVLVEGIFGALNFRRAGLQTFATMGSAVANSSWMAFASFSDRLVVFFDSDPAGRSGAMRVARLTGARVVWPGGEADELDSDTIREMVANARPLSQLIKEGSVKWEHHLNISAKKPNTSFVTA